MPLKRLSSFIRPALKEPVYVAQGTDREGVRQMLGFWVMGGSGQSSNAWKEILSELKARSEKDVDIFLSDDLAGIEEAARSVYPASIHQLCVAHAMRNARTKVRRRDSRGGVCRSQGDLPG